MEVKNIASRSWLLLAIASVLMLVGAFGVWETYGPVSKSALINWHGAVAFVGGILLLIDASLISGGLRIEAHNAFNVGMGIIGGLLGVFGATTYWLGMTSGSAGWGLYLTISAGLLALLTSFGLFKLRRFGGPAIPKGLSGT